MTGLTQKYRVAMKNSKSTIPEGKFKYFLTVEGYEKIGTTALAMLMNATKIDSVAQIPNDFKKTLFLKDNLQNKVSTYRGSDIVLSTT